MYVINARNVNDAYKQGYELVVSMGEFRESRGGQVLVLGRPLVTCYRHPRERVLLDPGRNANPFFHLIESLWMLAGMDDAARLNRYVGDFSGRYAEDDGNIHDAYGRRWRSAFGFDQIKEVIRRLRADQNDRQCVLQMWDCDTGRENDLLGEWRTRPCNTHAYFSWQRGALDLTLCCRSNDMVWGAYGANVVQFTMLLEYVAGMTGLPVGTFYQISNNFHVYRDLLVKLQAPGKTRTYPGSEPIGDEWSDWDEDLAVFWSTEDDPEGFAPYRNKWFATVAEPVRRAHWYFKRRELERCAKELERIGAPDWRLACTEWVTRRLAVVPVGGDR